MTKPILIDTNKLDMDYELKVDTKSSMPIPTVILSFPNSTQVTIRGDEEVVKQIVDRLDGLVVEYKAY